MITDEQVEDWWIGGTSPNPTATVAGDWNSYIKALTDPAEGDSAALRQGFISMVPYRGNTGNWLTANKNMIFAAVAVVGVLAIVKGKR
jgi:hypothetical protein